MFGLYLHVPFCASRCGYCDFNTYTPGELGTSASQASYFEALRKELEMAASQVNRPAQTVFFGGGTPSLLGAEALAGILDVVRGTIGLSDNAEITTESNPESTSPEFFATLLDAGFNRISLGMQSASPQVLKVLERRHTPGRAVAAAREARAAGFTHVNLDMIYGTPTETDDDVRRTLDAILDTGVDHVSAYSLIVEDGTAMARKVRRGELPAPDEDTYADRYALIDKALTDAGFRWYEVSNWAHDGGECEHNLIYWRGGHWWGAGPGAHSSVDGRRFYNVKHPARYHALLDEGHLPIADSEDLTDADLHTEALMLGLRLREGVPLSWIGEGAREVVDKHVRAGLMRVTDGRLAVTEAGRLLADGLIADLLVAEER
ncbi:coproporphyrinogen III oxidase [Corynebacterium yudongzhengii]|uniref:Heme chaperone HemW n=1 Tax=Corynebacterium yudongzhengii TaxID=2080740 RepID=A0A2U1T7V2_9CORY|nr:radical SAM family heme chaperone HemW [Corynebacterium yudongzhengii]AWB81460.1 coproporphyrinogen III oxidase [Corynebacterium yudongzhengii]PWC01968.1 coproporphyrinogen III oxidase [Corynebacterium yudongzhengii]